jgi:predicted nucleotide-binding protein
MVVHGRDATLNEAIFTFLRAIGLDPLEWPMLRAATEKPMPYVGEVLDQAFQRAQAVVVLMTGDDLAKLQDRHLKPGDQGYERELTPQARPNVLFEAGMALASHPDRTIIVEVGDLRPFSDVAGRYVVHMTNEASDRLDLIERLQTAGCPAVQVGRGWLTAGNFSPA